jgi:hypothetical protein
VIINPATNTPCILLLKIYEQVEKIKRANNTKKGISIGTCKNLSRGNDMFEEIRLNPSDMLGGKK